MSLATTSAGKSYCKERCEHEGLTRCLVRYLQVVKSIWSGLPNIYKEAPKQVVEPCLYDGVELADLLVFQLDINAGFTLTDSQDPRYQKVVKMRLRFGTAIQRAASVLRRNNGGED